MDHPEMENILKVSSSLQRLLLSGTFFSVVQGDEGGTDLIISTPTQQQHPQHHNSNNNNKGNKMQEQHLLWCRDLISGLKYFERQ